MAWISTIDEADATGAVKDAFDAIGKARGKLSNIMRVHSLRPDAMLTHMELYKVLMFSKSDLSRADRELIGTVVSAINGCDYCVNHHAEALNAYWKDRPRVSKAINNYKEASLTPQQQGMIDYAVKLTRRSAVVCEADISNLRSLGWSEQAILDMVMITGYFNFVNRIASGLGVEFSSDEVRGYNY